MDRDCKENVVLSAQVKSNVCTGIGIEGKMAYFNIDIRPNPEYKGTSDKVPEKPKEPEIPKAVVKSSQKCEIEDFDLFNDSNCTSPNTSITKEMIQMYLYEVNTNLGECKYKGNDSGAGNHSEMVSCTSENSVGIFKYMKPLYSDETPSCPGQSYVKNGTLAAEYVKADMCVLLDKKEGIYAKAKINPNSNYKAAETDPSLPKLELKQVDIFASE